MFEPVSCQGNLLSICLKDGKLCLEIWPSTHFKKKTDLLLKATTKINQEEKYIPEDTSGVQKLGINLVRGEIALAYNEDLSRLIPERKLN